MKAPPAPAASTPTAPSIDPAGDVAGRPAPPTVQRGPEGFLCRAHILDATAVCFAEEGYEGTTLRAIARRLGCSVGSIYRYFDDKDALLLACGRRVLESVPGPLEEGDFERSVRRYVDAAASHGDLYRLTFRLAAGAEGGAAAVVEPIIVGWAKLLGDRDEAERCWAIAHGMVALGGDADRVLRAIGGPSGRRAPSRPRKPPPPPDFGPPKAEGHARAEAPSAPPRCDDRGREVEAPPEDDLTLL